MQGPTWPSCGRPGSAQRRTERAVVKIVAVCITVCGKACSAGIVRRLPGSRLDYAGTLGSFSARSCQRRLAGAELCHACLKFWVLLPGFWVHTHLPGAVCAACFEPVLCLVVLAMRFVYWTGESATFNCRCVNSTVTATAVHGGSAAVPSMPRQPPCGGMTAWAGQPQVAGTSVKCHTNIHPRPAMPSSLIYWKRYMRRTRERIHVAKGQS